MIAELAVARKLETTGHELIRQSHPTMSEVYESQQQLTGK
jgi:hypothetical protein